MAIAGVIRAVTALAITCRRRASRAARRLRGPHAGLARLSRRVSVIPFLGDRRRRIGGEEEARSDGSEDASEETEGEGVWRRAILMGEKCQPLDFSGVIYYGPDGRQLAEVPTPRSPLRAPLPLVAGEEKVWRD